jgi:hypothetical protein
MVTPPINDSTAGHFRQDQGPCVLVNDWRHCSDCGAATPLGGPLRVDTIPIATGGPPVERRVLRRRCWDCARRRADNE